MHRAGDRNKQQRICLVSVKPWILSSAGVWDREKEKEERKKEKAKEEEEVREEAEGRKTKEKGSCFQESHSPCK